MKLSRNIAFYIVFTIIVTITSVALSCVIANILSLVYAPQEELLNMIDLFVTPRIMIQRLFEVEAVNQMFWIILSMFGLLVFVANYKRWFGLKDYKSNVYRVTDDIEIPVKIGDKQTQQGSSWWLNKKEFSKVFNVNTVDSENSTIRKLLYNADEETKAIKNISIPYKKVNESEIIDEEKLKEEIKNEFGKINKKTIEPDKSRVFKNGGIVLGRRERRVFSRVSKFPFVKSRKVEDIYFVGDNIHTLTVGSTRSGKTRCLVIESIYNCALAGESMIISDPKRRAF